MNLWVGSDARAPGLYFWTRTSKNINTFLPAHRPTLKRVRCARHAVAKLRAFTRRIAPSFRISPTCRCVQSHQLSSTPSGRCGFQLATACEPCERSACRAHPTSGFSIPSEHAAGVCQSAGRSSSLLPRGGGLLCRVRPDAALDPVVEVAGAVEHFSADLHVARPRAVVAPPLHRFRNRADSLCSFVRRQQLRHVLVLLLRAEIRSAKESMEERAADWKEMRPTQMSAFYVGSSARAK